MIPERENPRLILASASPRRRQILHTLGLSFEVRPAEIEEQAREGEPADRFALRMAEEKALAVSREAPEAFVLGSDTVVVHDGAHLGKPAEPAEARAMIRGLQGRTHEVMTALSLARGGERLGSRLVTTEVRFAPLSEAQIEAYVESGEGVDKAGGYAVQGLASGFVSEVRGSYSSVVGLPAEATVAMLLEHGALLSWPPPPVEAGREEEG